MLDTYKILSILTQRYSRLLYNQLNDSSIFHNAFIHIINIIYNDHLDM